MICKYSYVTKDFVEHGEFQADTEDFKDFWRRERSNIRCACVKTEHDGWWIFYRGMKPKWEKVKRGDNDCYQTVLKF